MGCATGTKRGRMNICLVFLVDAKTLRWVQLAEEVELVQRGNGNEDQVPHHQDDTETLVQLPAVHVGREQKEKHGGQ